MRRARRNPTDAQRAEATVLARAVVAMGTVVDRVAYDTYGHQARAAALVALLLLDAHGVADDPAVGGLLRGLARDGSVQRARRRWPSVRREALARGAADDPTTRVALWAAVGALSSDLVSPTGLDAAVDLLVDAGVQPDAAAALLAQRAIDPMFCATWERPDLRLGHFNELVRDYVVDRAPVYAAAVAVLRPAYEFLEQGDLPLASEAVEAFERWTADPSPARAEAVLRVAQRIQRVRAEVPWTWSDTTTWGHRARSHALGAFRDLVMLTVQDISGVSTISDTADAQAVSATAAFAIQSQARGQRASADEIIEVERAAAARAVAAALRTARSVIPCPRPSDLLVALRDPEAFPKRRGMRLTTDVAVGSKRPRVRRRR